MRLVLHLVAQAPEGVFDDEVVVEGELGDRSSAGTSCTFSPTLRLPASSDRTSAQYTIETTRRARRTVDAPNA